MTNPWDNLNLACKNGDIPTIESLLKQGVTPQINKDEALLSAIHSKNKKAIELLLYYYPTQNLKELLDEKNNSWIVLNRNEILTLIKTAYEQNLSANHVQKPKKPINSEEKIEIL